MGLWSSGLTETRELKQARRAYSATLARLREAFPASELVNPETAPRQVVEALRGAGWMVWQEVDEGSGYRDLESWRFALVRQTRNSPVYGPELVRAVNEPPRLTLAFVRDQLRGEGCRVVKLETGEYLVRIIGSPSDHGYFAADLRDALDTGRAMAREEAGRRGA